MQAKRILLLGFGDLAHRVSTHLCQAGHHITGVARSLRRCRSDIQFWQGAIADAHIVNHITATTFDVAVITLTPGGRGNDAYRRAYVDNIKVLLAIWSQSARPPGLVVFVSSTSVYGQSAGEWVDEQSQTMPKSPGGQRILESEQLLLASTLNTCMVRFSGIYGPGRTHVLKQVQAGIAGGEAYTNRIHADDCAAFIVHLCQQHWQGQPLAPCYLASDSCPVPAKTLRLWLANQLGYEPTHLSKTLSSSRGGNKRCSNRLVLASGFEFSYPSFKEGYTALLA